MRLAAALLAAAVASTLLAPSVGEEEYCGVSAYNTNAQRSANSPLNVHLIPHTHDDAGWLKNIDEYYFGDAQAIQPAGVQYELDSIIPALEADPARKFVYSDIGFFAMWWGEQTQGMRARVRSLVRGGRLSFVNGGWVQHDEACPSWELMVDQLTRGHRWVAANFGPAAVPTVSWQIDPFGHSATHAALAGAAGFEAVYFARADFKDVKARAASSNLEHLWRGEPSYGASADVFAGTFMQGNYSAPWGFSFDWLQADPPIIDNTCAAPGVNNVAARVDAFVAAVTELAKPVSGAGDVMLTMGADFQYAAAGVYFKNLDKLVHHVNADGRVNVFYSTPAAYTAAKRAAPGVAWPVKTDDFFPFASAENEYWTGYFTSRPGQKLAIARSVGELAAVRQLAVLSGGGADAGEAKQWEAALDAFESAVAFGAHHDTITGTSKQHVTNSYMARLSRAWAGVEPLAGAALAARAGVDAGAVAWCRSLNASVCAPSARASAAGKPFTVLLYNSLASTRTEGVRIPIKADGAPAWKVTGPGGEAVPAQVQAASPGGAAAAASLVAAGGAAAADAPGHELAFVATLPPLGAAAYVVAPVPPGTAGAAQAPTPVGHAWGGSKKGAAADTTLESPGGTTITLTPRTAARASEGAPTPTSASLTVDAATGEVRSLASARPAGDNPTTAAPGFDVQMGYYKAADDNGKGIASGAYILRTDASPLYMGFDLDAGGKGVGPPVRTAATGPALATYSVVYAPGGERGAFAAATVRLWAGLPDAEVEWTAGLPAADSVGREVVVSYSSGLAGDGTFSTDANGRRNLRRARNARPTFTPDTAQETASNFYPITSAATVEDGRKPAEGGGLRVAMTLVTDRAQAAAVGPDTSAARLDVLVHRRLFKDDWKGVNEPLNETECGCVPSVSTAGITGHTACACGGAVVSGVHSVVLAPAGRDGAAVRRAAQARAARPLLVAVIEGEGTDTPPPLVSSALAPALADAGGLPPNLHLVTLAPAGRPGAPDDGVTLLRLAHTFEAGEDPGGLSSPVTVDLNGLLAGVAWEEATEVTLTAARPLADAPARKGWSTGTGMLLGDAATKAADVALRPDAGRATPDEPLVCAGECAGRPLPVTLGPMQVRTFLAKRAA